LIAGRASLAADLRSTARQIRRNQTRGAANLKFTAKSRRWRETVFARNSGIPASLGECQGLAKLANRCGLERSMHER
jgi:hypothetical protein